MIQALRLAVEIRFRQYVSFLADCVANPAAAASELTARPERWWAGAVAFLLIAAPLQDLVLHHALGLPFILALALLCRSRAGGVRPMLWLTVWGYSFFPSLAARAALAGLMASLALILKTMMLLYGRNSLRLREIAPSFDAAAGPVILAAMVLIILAGTLATLRLTAACVREAAGVSTARAMGLVLAAFALGTVSMIFVFGGSVGIF